MKKIIAGILSGGLLMCLLTGISDEMITELMDYPRNMMLSIDIIPVAMDEAVSDIRKRIMSVESDITRWQQRQNQSNNFTANIPYDLEQMRSETKEFMDDLMSRDQRMMLALVTLTHLADNLEQLDHIYLTFRFRIDLCFC